MDSQSTKKGVFLCVAGGEGSDFDSSKSKKEMITYVSWCFMCKSLGNDVDYLLLHCQVANRLWRAILNLFGVQWVMSGIVKAVLHVGLT